MVKLWDQVTVHRIPPSKTIGEKYCHLSVLLSSLFSGVGADSQHTGYSCQYHYLTHPGCQSIDCTETFFSVKISNSRPNRSLATCDSNMGSAVSLLLSSTFPRFSSKTDDHFFQATLDFMRHDHIEAKSSSGFTHIHIRKWGHGSIRPP